MEFCLSDSKAEQCYAHAKEKSLTCSPEHDVCSGKDDFKRVFHLKMVFCVRLTDRI